MSQDKRTLQSFFHFSQRFRDLSQRGMETALAELPKCHFGKLEHLYYAIEHAGQDGGIYVSQLNKAIGRPAPAVSRTLRSLEQEGLIERTADAADRRKILVRLTPEGERLRAMSEEAVLRYAQAVLARMKPERLQQVLAFQRELEEAVDAENAARQPQTQATKGETHNP